MADYIDRNKAINALEYNNKVFHYADSDKENIVLETVDKLCQVLCEMPAADVQPIKKTEFQIGYEQGFKDGRASAALPNLTDHKE